MSSTPLNPNTIVDNNNEESSNTPGFTKFLVVKLSDDSNHLTIWYNAPAHFIEGGKSVEAGYGSNKFKTQQDLKNAIVNTLRQIQSDSVYPDKNINNEDEQKQA